MAKVEEAREVPSIKVLDEADVPEKKSFPPRMLIVLFGLLLACSVGAVWVLVRASWLEVDADDPGRVLAREIVQTVSASPWVSKTLRYMKNGAANGTGSRDHDETREQKENPEHDSE